MTKTINTESFIEAWEGERCLRDVSSVTIKNATEKEKTRKKLAEQLSIVHSQKTTLLRLVSNHTDLRFF